MIRFDLDEVFFPIEREIKIHSGCEVRRKLFQVAYSIYMHMRVTLFLARLSWKRADIYIYIHLLSHTGCTCQVTFFFLFCMVGRVLHGLCLPWTCEMSCGCQAETVSAILGHMVDATEPTGWVVWGVLGWGGIASVELARMVDATHCRVGWVVGTGQIVPCANATRFAINALWPKTGPDKPTWTKCTLARPLPKLCLFCFNWHLGLVTGIEGTSKMLLGLESKN